MVSAPVPPVMVSVLATVAELVKLPKGEGVAAGAEIDRWRWRSLQSIQLLSAPEPEVSVSTVLNVAVLAALPRLMTTDTAASPGEGETRDGPFCPSTWRGCALARTTALRLRREEIVRGHPALSAGGVDRGPTFVSLSGGMRVAAPKPNLSSSIWLIVAGLVVISALGLFSGGGGGGSGTDVIPYSQFQQYLDANKVKQVTVAGNVIRGTLTETMPDGRTTSAPCRCHPTSPASSPSTTSSSAALRPTAARLARCCRGCCRHCCSSASGCLPRG